MSDISDPEILEERDQASRQNYKVYKRRWPVLMAVFTITLMNGLQKSILPIVDHFNSQMGMTMDEYDLMTQISLVVCLITVIPFARALERYKLRRMAYFNCVAIVMAHSLKAICCFENNFVIIVQKQYRFHVLLIAEVFVGLALGISSAFPAKMAYDWFPIHESTRSLVLAGVGFNVGAGASNYLAPKYVTKPEDMYRLGYMFIFSAMFMTAVVLLFIQRSRPKMPPSSSAILSQETQVPLKDGLIVMLNNPSFLLLLANFSLNYSALGALQLIFQDVLGAKGYTDEYCGELLSHSYIFGVFFLLVGAAWIDNSNNYIEVSRTSSLLYGLTFIVFCASLNFPDINKVIVVTNVLVSFGNSIVVPALTQVSVRCAATILQEGTTSALTIFMAQTAGALLINLEGPLKKLSPMNNVYGAQLSVFATLVVISNVLYAVTFKVPNRETLQNHLSERRSIRNPPEVLRDIEE